MTPDTDFDAYLRRQLEEAALPDHNFTAAVRARIVRHRRRRRLALAGAVSLASVVTFVAVRVSPLRAIVLPDITLEGVVGTLLLVTACSLVWIGTEPSSWARIARMSERGLNRLEMRS